jgi:hypothetical protein
MLESRWAKIDILLRYFNIDNIDMEMHMLIFPFILMWFKCHVVHIISDI